MIKLFPLFAVLTSFSQEGQKKGPKERNNNNNISVQKFKLSTYPKIVMRNYI